MLRGRCPICSRTFEVASLDDLPTFPFCCERCRLIDLGRWIDGVYRLPVGAAQPQPSEGDESERLPDPDDEDA